MEVAYAIGMFAASVWVCLPLIYWFTAPEFYKTLTGRTIMTLLASISAMFILLMTFRLIGDYPLRPFVNSAVYAFLAWGGFKTAFLFFQLKWGPQGDPQGKLTNKEKDETYGPRTTNKA